MTKVSLYTLGLFAFAGVVMKSNAVPDGVLKLDVRHKHVSRPAARSPNQNRASTLPVPLTFNDQWITQGGYLIDVDIGTPP